MLLFREMKGFILCFIVKELDKERLRKNRSFISHVKLFASRHNSKEQNIGNYGYRYFDFTKILVLGFYKNIGNVEKYRWIF